MHLRSLTIRGFKSFADRVHLEMEPGITAIVGPNGSGKSNISDAVLWVLGERNAKHLRGNSMEDVIFDGSTTRRGASVAEVELVLDNSDGVLPVDYDEVVIARRMYRTGESEYLVNGSIVRRMDVLDILHDTGLGVGTHSIISQGSIDSVLRSKPEERRSLIEEAAGVLKHKQRMARSARKLERMGSHVERVSDIVGEVGRQLGPLERRAKRAKRYEELSAERSEARLLLAVDDLRQLQERRSSITEESAKLEEEVASRRSDIDEVEAAIAELQKELRERSDGVGEISKKHHDAAVILSRIRSTVAMVRERGDQALRRATEIEVSLERARELATRQRQELTRSQVKADSSKAKETEASESASKLEAEYERASSERDSLAAKLEGMRGDVERLRREESDAKREQALARETLTDGLAHMKVLDAHVSELELIVARNEADSKRASAELEQLESTLAVVESQERESRELLATCSRARDAAREALDEARATERAMRAQIDALDQMEARRAEDAGSARAWVDERRGSGDLDATPLSQMLRSDEECERIVESLLGTSMDALILEGSSSIENTVAELEGEHVEGEISMISLDPSRDGKVFAIESARKAATEAGRSLLIDHLDHPGSLTEAVTALLGDVVVCETWADALAGHSAFPAARFASLDGMFASPSGLVSLGAEPVEAERGVLARMRRLDELRSGLEHAIELSERAQRDASAAEESLADAQSESLKLSERLAELRGSAQSAKAVVRTAADKLSSSARELERALEQRRKAESDVESARPDMEKHRVHAEELSSEITSLEERVKEAAAELAPIADSAQASSEALSEARLTLTKARERRIYDEMMCDRQREDLESSIAEIDRLESSLRVKRVSASRLKKMNSSMERLDGLAVGMVDGLERASMDAASSTSELHEEGERLRKLSSEAHSAFEQASSRLADIRVESARIEMQMETSASEIVDELGVPLERALTLPGIEDRTELEGQVMTLDRRIANLGTINPDAAREYDELKERYDFLDGQLEDLREASRALMRIDRMIEARMKEDFIETFERIDADFQEIFSILFPGGEAHLSLEDPENLEETGVEVNAQPAGKRISKMSLMSGGEKSLVALALLFALYRTRPTPFYILDEVEAALDDTNLRRLNAYIDELRTTTQLIMITHQRRTMEMADVLFGVSMQDDGISKVVSQKLDRALEQAD